MIKLNNSPIANILNKPKISNFLETPNAGVYSVATLIGINNSCRMYASLTDKKEPSKKARYYTAINDCLQEVFCVIAMFAIIPGFRKAGLKLGKSVIAKDSFAKLYDEKLTKKSVNTLENIGNDNNLNPVKFIGEKEDKFGVRKLIDKVTGFNKDQKEDLGNAVEEGIKKSKEGFIKKFKTFCSEKITPKMHKIHKALDKTDDYNKSIKQNIREILFSKDKKMKEYSILIKTREGIYKITNKGKEDHSIIENLLTNANNSTEYEKEITKKAKKGAKGLNDIIKDGLSNGLIEKCQVDENVAKKQSKTFFTTGYEYLASNKNDHDIIVGSKGFGEAMGFLFSLSFLAAKFSTFLDPIILKYFKLEDEPKQAKNKELDNNKNSKINTNHNKSAVNMEMNQFLSVTAKNKA